MNKFQVVISFAFSILFISLCSCGKPKLNSLSPNSGPPHTLVETQGDDFLSKILWDSDQTNPNTLPGFWLGGGPFSVPVGVSNGNHQVSLFRNNEMSDASVAFNVTNPTVVFPNPSATHISTGFSENVAGTPNRVKFFLFVQGPNIDVGAKIEVDGTENESSLWKAIRYNSAGLTPSTLGYPIFHYAMIFTVIEANIGSTINVRVKNLDNNFSNTLTFNVPTELEWDSDGDGLLDKWEEDGFDSNSDGTIDCNLPAMGADKFIYDIFVEADFMDGKTSTAPDKIPATGTWSIAEQTFENSPFINIQGGLQGIQLHVDRGQSTFTDLEGITHTIPTSERKGGQILPFSDYIRNDNNTPSFALSGETSENFYDLKATNFDNASRREIFHYAIFANKHGHTNGSSGRGEIYGNDFFVTLSDSRLSSIGNSAGTFLHEFGHNLNLRHGGNDNTFRKPNHLSIMSYYSFNGSVNNAYQFAGVDNNCDRTPDGVYDYSHGMLNILNENSLDENIGTCNNVNVDWNGNNTIENNISSNIDGSTATTLQDHNNWGRDFKFTFRLAPDYND